MKNKIFILYLHLTLFVIMSNLLFAHSDNDCTWNHFDRMMYKGLEGETNMLINIERNDTVYNVNIICYDGIPYKGQVLQTPMKEINYWNKSHLVQTGIEYSAGIPMRHLLDIKIEDTLVSFRDVNVINMYMVDALTGDTTFTHTFPKPITMFTMLDTVVNGGGYIECDGEVEFNTSEVNRLKQMLLYDGHIDPVTGNIVMEWTDVVSSVSYLPLPSGIYFAYFVNADDGKLRWVEKIVKE